MKLLNHPVLLALGISTLCLLFLIGPLISPNHDLVYHLRWSAVPVFLAVGIDLGILWLFTAIVLHLAERYPRVWFPVWLGIVLFLPWIALKNAEMLQGWRVSHRVMAGSLLLIVAVFVAFLSLGRNAVEEAFLPVQRFACVLLGFMGLAALPILVQVGWCAWAARNLNPPFVAAPRSVSSPESTPHPRVIWILLDELSYRQVYEERFPGLQLPAFDQMASQSVVFTHVLPAGISTEPALASLFSGLAADQIRVSADGRLRSLRDPVTGAWQPFDQSNTIFADARAANYATGIAGWYNPYCRILPEVLDRCFWIDRNPLLHYSQLDETWSARLSGSLLTLVHYIAENLHMEQPPEPDSVIGAEMHIRDFQETRDASYDLLEDPSIDFAFLHLPVPHPPGIFDRKRMTFATMGSSYISNLALADQYLAHVRLLLEQRRQWDSATVIVMGDHSWRTKLLWETAPEWTREEQSASNGGEFDDRPGYIVKMPMQQTPLRVETPFRAVKTRALLDAVISSQLRTGRQVKEWAERQR